MRRDLNYLYFVEGQCEKKLITVLKEKQLVRSGKVIVFNVIQNLLNDMHIRPIAPNTIVILVFDTDINPTKALLCNIAFLSSQPNVQKVICITQVSNLEDEITKCTNVKSPRELLGCKDQSSFKQSFINEKRLFDKLHNHYFSISKLWSSVPPNEFLALGITNQSADIKN